VHWGLDRVTGALAELGDPHLAIPTLHVGGTNGKGSVASTLASALTAAGHRTALYTSPHLCSFGERFQIGGRLLDQGALVAASDDIRDVVVRHGLTFFEAATVLAFHAFAREGAAIGVIEVGLGGRLDATNVVRPLVAAVTNVAMDHAEFLGDTLALIAAEKAGIAKAGVPLITAETDPELRAVLRSESLARGATFLPLDPAAVVRDVEVALDHTSFTVATSAWGPLRLTTPLVGVHQAVNTALAVLALEQLPDALLPSAEAVRRGVAGVSWPGRGQIVRIGGTSWLLDVAHNTAGVRSLVDVLDRLPLPEPRVALVGVLGDKEWREMLPPLFERVSGAVLTQPPSAPVERRWNPDEAAAAVRPLLPPGYPLATEADFDRALARARADAGAGTVVVTGSCHTVGDALGALARCPFRE
jgi:dihydrofolate synthase/folylpolyglutamate synthase